MIIVFLKNEVKEEIIWPDDRISKFKNKYMCHLKDKFSATYTRFLWKFSATSHSKGAVDGIHGNVKSTVQSHWAKKGQDHCAGCKVFLSSRKQSNEHY